MVWLVTGVNALITGALPKLMLSAEMVQSLATVRVTVKGVDLLPELAPMQMPPMPIPGQ